jgi:ABC-2 type transport system ATP-binding protein
MMADDQGASIEVRALSKRFGDVQALAGVSFDVRAGELFGFLGPNGAGKTTTINILTGLARPDAGTVRIQGIDCSANPKAAQHLIGVVPDESNLYPELTGFENLSFCASLYGMRKGPREARARQLLDEFDLSQAADRRFAGYSRGMKRKLTIAAGIIHRPRLLFLDEPTTGIDVASARRIRQLISELRRGGTTIFLTTHYIEEAERLCDRIAFIVAGRIVRVDAVANLLQGMSGRHVVRFALSAAPPEICRAVASVFPRAECTAVAENVLRMESGESIPVGPVVRFLEERGAEVEEARKVQPSLEEIFVETTGVEAEAMSREKEKGGAAA